MALRITTPPADTPAALDKTATAAKLGTTDEASVLTLIERMTALAETLADVRLWYRGYRERIEGDSGDRLYLQARPIAAVSSVRFATDDPLTEGTEDDEFEVWAEEGFLYLANCWDSGRPGWTIDYTGGWWLTSMGATPATGAVKLETDRPDVALAISEMVTLQWQIDTGDRRIKSAKLSSMAVEYETGLWIPKTAEAILRGLRRPSF